MFGKPSPPKKPYELTSPIDDVVTNLRDTLYAESGATTTTLAVKMPCVVHVAATSVYAPYPVSVFAELAMFESGMLSSKTTAVDAQLAPSPVQSFNGALRSMGVPAPDGRDVTRSYGDAIERKTK